MTTPSTPKPPRRTTRTYRLSRERLVRNLRSYDDEAVLDWAIERHCPDAWRTLEEDVECHEKRVSVTLRLDTSVAQFFRAMGPGYQRRINRVLATYAQMRICEVRAWRSGEAIFEHEFETRRKGAQARDLAEQLALVMNEEAGLGEWEVVRKRE